MKHALFGKLKSHYHIECLDCPTNQTFCSRFQNTIANSARSRLQNRLVVAVKESREAYLVALGGERWGQSTYPSCKVGSFNLRPHPVFLLWFLLCHFSCWNVYRCFLWKVLESIRIMCRISSALRRRGAVKSNTQTINQLSREWLCLVREQL